MKVTKEHYEKLKQMFEEYEKNVPFIAQRIWWNVSQDDRVKDASMRYTWDWFWNSKAFAGTNNPQLKQKVETFLWNDDNVDYTDDHLTTAFKKILKEMGVGR